MILWRHKKKLSYQIRFLKPLKTKKKKNDTKCHIRKYTHKVYIILWSTFFIRFHLSGSSLASITLAFHLNTTSLNFTITFPRLPADRTERNLRMNWNEKKKTCIPLAESSISGEIYGIVNLLSVSSFFFYIYLFTRSLCSLSFFSTGKLFDHLIYFTLAISLSLIHQVDNSFSHSAAVTN